MSPEARSSPVLGGPFHRHSQEMLELSEPDARHEGSKSHRTFGKPPYEFFGEVDFLAHFRVVYVFTLYPVFGQKLGLAFEIRMGACQKSGDLTPSG